MKLVVLESPYAGSIALNTEYARRCLRDCLDRGEAAFAGHLLYTQPGVLSDAIPAERKLGIEAGLAWGAVAKTTVVYVDLGLSEGVILGIEAAKRAGRIVEVRSLFNRPKP